MSTPRDFACLLDLDVHIVVARFLSRLQGTLAEDAGACGVEAAGRVGAAVEACGSAGGGCCCCWRRDVVVRCR